MKNNLIYAEAAHVLHGIDTDLKIRVRSFEGLKQALPWRLLKQKKLKIGFRSRKEL